MQRKSLAVDSVNLLLETNGRVCQDKRVSFYLFILKERIPLLFFDFAF